MTYTTWEHKAWVEHLDNNRATLTKVSSHLANLESWTNDDDNKKTLAYVVSLLDKARHTLFALESGHHPELD